MIMMPVKVFAWKKILVRFVELFAVIVAATVIYLSLFVDHSRALSLYDYVQPLIGILSLLFIADTFNSWQWISGRTKFSQIILFLVLFFCLTYKISDNPFYCMIGNNCFVKLYNFEFFEALNCFRVVDIFWLIIVVYLVVRYREKLEGAHKPTISDPICEIEKDCFDRENLVNIIVNTVDVLGKGRTSRVGIVGNYGAGKTSLMKMVEQQIHTRNKTMKTEEIESSHGSGYKPVITVWLDAYKFENQTKFWQCFADSIEERTKDHFECEKTTIWEFILSLLPKFIEKKLDFTGISEKITQVFDKTSSSVDAKAHIQTFLTNKLSFIVFVDNVDRALSKTSTLEMLMAIQEVMNFIGVTFVIAYDENILASQISTIFQTVNSIDTAQRYIDKYFDSKFIIPPTSAVQVKKFVDRVTETLGKESNHFIEHSLKTNFCGFLSATFSDLNISNVREIVCLYIYLSLSIKSIDSKKVLTDNNAMGYMVVRIICYYYSDVINEIYNLTAFFERTISASDGRKVDEKTTFERLLNNNRYDRLIKLLNKFDNATQSSQNIKEEFKKYVSNFSD